MDTNYYSTRIFSMSLMKATYHSGDGKDVNIGQSWGPDCGFCHLLARDGGYLFKFSQSLCFPCKMDMTPVHIPQGDHKEKCHRVCVMPGRE